MANELSGTGDDGNDDATVARTAAFSLAFVPEPLQPLLPCRRVIFLIFILSQYE